MLYQYQGVKPNLDKTVYIAPGAHIIGKVEIGVYSSIWFNTVVRGDINKIKIGSHSNIQDNSVIHVDAKYPTTIGDYVLVGHKVIIHGSQVGSGSLIGMGSTLLDGSIIGENTLIGAGTLVKEGQKIPAGVLALGSPARVIRELKKEEIEWIRRAVERYSERAQVFKKELKPV